MRFLVDTNVISEFRKGKLGAPGVQRWAESVNATDMAISVVTLKELEAGVLGIARRDPSQGLALRAWLDHFMIPKLDDRILTVDREIAVRCAALEVPDPKPLADALLAATAFVHGLVVVSRNTKHFKPMRVPLLNPWDHPA